MASARTCVARVRSHWTRGVAAQMPGAAERGAGVLLTLKTDGAVRRSAGLPCDAPGGAEMREAALKCTRQS